MKKFCIVFMFLFIIILTVCMSATPAAGTESEFLRVHIRANSDAVCDQSVKYEVKDAAVDYLMPLAAACQSKAQAMKRIEEVLSEIEQVADEVLREHGYSYCAKAKLTREEFPTPRLRERNAGKRRVRRAYSGTRRGIGRQLVVRDLPPLMLCWRGDRREYTLPFGNLRYHCGLLFPRFGRVRIDFKEEK